MRSLLAGPPFGRNPSASLALLVAVTMTGTLGLHVFVPALPFVAGDLHATPFQTQLTITLYLCGLAAGQLVYGPISDALGRRPVIIASLSLYLLGFLAAIPAPTIGLLIVARVLQSLGGCGSLVIGRAMVRDVSTAEDAARQIAVLTIAMTITPALAPVLGGVVTTWIGWRAVFVVLAVLVGALLALVILTLPETNRRPVSAPGIGPILAGYRRLLRSAKFRNYLVAGSCGGTSLYAFLAVAPFLLTDVLGRPAAEVGAYCLIVTAGMIAGSVLARRIAGRVEIRHAARRGNLLCLTSALALLAIDLSGQLSVLTLLAPLVIYSVGIGVASPNAVAGLMNVDPDAAGSASSLYGFSQMAFGAGFTLIVSLWHSASATPVAATLILASVLAALALQRV
jgi:DHA1 family bicyclomycin/chloramphenicol resistance-like MFS transporter